MYIFIEERKLDENLEVGQWIGYACGLQILEDGLQGQSVHMYEGKEENFM